jgi:propane 2-monooxygenase small subunit
MTRDRGEGSERTFGWFEPARRRATVYEDVTIDTQPSIHRHVDRSWPVRFEDGRGTWSEESTRLRSRDWYAFRDPGEVWERPFYQQGSGAERQIEAAIRSARDAGLFDDFSPEWVDFLRRTLQVPAFVEHGLWLATATAARDVLSDSIAHCVVLEAAMKQRQAQALVLYGMDLEEQFGGFDVDAAKSAWVGDLAWQPARAYVERLRTVCDWGELIVAVNASFEPLVAEPLRRDLLVRSAVANGDAVTPALMAGAQLEWEWTREWTRAFLDLVLGDAEHGDANRVLVEGWLDEWGVAAREVAAALEPVFDARPAGPSFEESRAAAERNRESLVGVTA